MRRLDTPPPSRYLAPGDGEMRIVIAGAGEIGFFLAKKLSVEKHDLVLIDQDPDTCQKVQSQLDVSILQGSASSQDTLREAGLKSADMFVGVTGVDEVNIVACLIAERMGVQFKIARVKNPGFLGEDSLVQPKELGIDLLIHPEEEAVAAINRLLLRSAASEIIEMEQGRLLMVGLKLDGGCPNLNRPLREVGDPEQRAHYRVVAIQRAGKTTIPTGESVLARNDEVFVITRREKLHEVLELTGKTSQKLEKLMILGGGRIGVGVAAAMEHQGLSVTLIEADRETSIRIAGQLSKTLVVNADGTAVDTLAAEGLLDQDAFVAVTSDDETNIITSLLARHLGVAKTIALVNKENYLPLMSIIGIDSTVSVRITAARAILNLIRRREVISVATFNDIDAEMIEVKLARNNRLVGRQLNAARLPEGALVAAIIRRGEVFVPYGDSILRTGDRIILFALPRAMALLRRDLLK